MSEERDTECLGHPDCPQCRAMSQQAMAAGAFGMALEQMIKDGTAERIGRDMALRYERALIDAILGQCNGTAK